MRTLALLLVLLLTPVVARAQESSLPEGTSIAIAEVAGIAIDQLSPGLRRDIDALADSPLNRVRLSDLAGRIETEHPDVVAAVRHVLRPDGRVHVVFLVARISDSADLESNINARYEVGQVDVSGIDRAAISRDLNDALDALIGTGLDPAAANALAHRLEEALPDYDVNYRVRRGDEPGRLHVTFRFRRAEERRWIRFTPSQSKLIFHEAQRWSGVFDLRAGGGNHQVGLGLVRGNTDDLVEEYSGFWLRAEAREIATKRVGLSMSFARLSADWRPQTVAALDPATAGRELYRRRQTVEPAMTVAFTRLVRVTGGVSASALESDTDPSAIERANTVFGRLGYDQRWATRDNADHRLSADVEVRSATDGLDSDRLYRRYLGHARYSVEKGESLFAASFTAGRLIGSAPLFERFTLGDSTTLRGWDKYAIAPTGANRVVHQSLEYRYRGFAYFVDAGSVWQAGEDRTLRFSTGVGFHTDHSFITFAFPLNDASVSARFLLGVRF